MGLSDYIDGWGLDPHPEPLTIEKVKDCVALEGHRKNALHCGYRRFR
jgi:hypothetical protein